MYTLHHPYLYLFAILLGTLSLTAQTTLGPGDIAFTGYNADQPDEFSFVLLKDVVATTTITFTDDEYGNSVPNALNTGEGRLTLTFGASFTCGNEFYFLNDISGNWIVTDGNANSSNLSLASTGISTLTFSISGETLLAFQDPNPGTTTNPASWIAGLNMTGVVWTLGNGNSADSQLPPTLTNGQTANAITPEVDNAKYNCSTISASPAILAAAINTESNWQVDNAILFTLNGPGFCGFTCGPSCIEPVLTSVSSTPEPVCLGATATINISGSVNGGGAWSLRTGSCTGPVEQTSATNSFSVSPTSSTTYYITAPNCNLTTSVCDNVTVMVSGIPANAGPDQLVPGTSTTLAGNNPAPSSGSWSIISGDGNGNIDTPSSPTSTFSGTAGEAYVLQWNIDGGPCGTATDEVKISFSLPTNLLLGELAFTEYVSSDPDYFSVVMLVDIKAGTEIHFTDKGWRDPTLSSPGGFRPGEGILTATWCAAYTCGSEFKLSDTAGSSGTSWDLRDASGNVAGTVVSSGGFLLSTTGDQIFAYQGSAPTETNQSNFRSAIHMNGDWDTNADGASTSSQPSIFSNNPNTSVVPNPTGTELDNAIYNCAVTASTVSSLQTALSNPDNWVITDTRPTNPNFCTFSCQACAEPVISGVTQDPNPVCAGDPVTINVTGSLNGATQWEVYNDSCDGTIVGSSTTNQISFAALTGGTYYLAGVDGCVATPNCTSFTLTLGGVAADIATDAIKVPQGTTTTTVSGNTPTAGATVSWTFVNVGDGNGVIASPGSVSTSFSGTAGQSYELRYTIQNPGCPATSDEVLVVFLDPTDLELGDVAFLSYNATSDDFAMVLLTDVNAGTQITLTERGWFAAGGFRPGEQTFTMEFCRAYPCGTEIDVFQTPELLILDVNDNTAGTLVSGSPLALAISGDQIFAYQGLEPSAGDQSNFLTAIQMNGAWDVDSSSASTSAKPSVFTDGVNSISISPEVNNARYDCSTTGPADGAALALSINDAANWNRNENIPYALPLECGISCCADATITSVTASPSEYCPGEMVSLTVSGSLNDATTWVWYEGGCAQGPSIGTGATIMVTPGAVTSYFVRGEGGCVGSTGLCQSVGVTPDNMPPSISCPADITSGNDAGQCTAVVNYTPPVGTDNCSGATTNQTAGLGAGATFPVGMTIETYTVTAANGQTASCSFNVTVNDTEAPSVDCAAVDGNRNNDPGFCSYTAQGNEFDPAFSDNCPGVSITNDFNNTSTLDGETFQVGTTTVNWTAMDAVGGTATCSVDVVVTDNEGPVITCQNVTVQLDANGNTGFNPLIDGPVLVTQSDNCNLAGGIFRTGPATFTCAQLGANLITIFKNDVNGNQTTCVITLTVDDTDFPCNQPPVANCKAPFMRSADGNCQASATVADINDGSFDPDGDPLTLSISPSGPYPIGPTTVVLTVDDGQATDQCSTTITVFDDTAPALPAPPADLNLDCAADVPPPVDLTATDNCDGPITVSPSAQITPGSCLNDFVMVRTWTFTDQYGNTSSVSQTITVLDDTAPALPAPPADLNLDCAADVPAPVDLTATDNCDGDITVSPTTQITPGACLNDFTMVRTWTFRDTCGNTSSVSQTITVLDDTAPALPAPPADLNLECAADVPAPVDLTATDNCDGSITVSPKITLLSGGCLNDFTMVRTWTFRDTCGNTSSVSQTISVLDNTAPALPAPPADLNLDCAADVPAPVALTATDNCDGNITVSPSSQTTPGACANDFTMVRFWTFTDQCGNTSSVSQTIIVKDDTAPALPAPPADLNLECAADVPAPVALTAVDNCDGDITVSPTTQITPGACLNDFTMVRTWTFRDTCGNTSSVSQTISVLDDTAPALPAPPADLKLECAADVPAPVALTATDNCDGDITVSPTTQITPGACLNDFIMVRTWTFRDTCGNTSSISQTIIVKDDTAPALPAPPADLNLECAADVPAPVDLTAVDNCNGDITVSPTTQITPGACLNDFTMVRTWTFRDTCGNTSSVSQTISVLDDTAPALPAPPADLNLECAADVPVPVDLTATDNCDGDITVSPTTQITPGACLNDFIMVRTWTFRDTCGNTSSISQTIIVKDDTAPALPAPPADLNLECAADVPAPVDLTATDNCDGDITVSPNEQTTPGASPNDFTLIRTWTFSDTCGNTSSTSQTITVLDTTDPVVDCSAINPNRNNDSGQCSYTAQGTEFDATATDNCGLTSLTNNYNNGSSLAGAIFLVGTTTVIWTALDAAGNSHSCSVDIVITDNEAAIAVCQAATIAIDANGDATLIPSDIDGGSSDNCDVFTLSVDNNDFDCYALGDHIVTLTATDNLGQFTTCTATVTVTGPDADCDQVADVCDLCPGGDDQVDNNNDGLPDCAYFPGLQDLIDEWKCSNGSKKVTICHIPGGNYANRSDVCVNPNAVAAHLAHGDFIGGCDNVTCDSPAILENNDADPQNNRGSTSFNSTFDLEPKVIIYPNPSTGLVHIDLSGFAKQNMRLKLMDARGQVQLVRTINVEGHQLESLQLGHLPSGVYWLKIETQSQVLITKRIVIQG